MLVVAHSPTPSMVTTTASSNGDGKKALAAWLWWCSANSSRGSMSLPPRFSNALRSVRFWNSFCFVQMGMAARKERKPRGAVAK